MMDDAAAASAPFDLRYLYLAGGGLPSATTAGCSGASGDWWGCWQDAALPPGQYVKDFVAKSAARAQLPLVTYYELLQASGASEGAGEVTATNDAALMASFAEVFGESGDVATLPSPVLGSARGAGQ